MATFTKPTQVPVFSSASPISSLTRVTTPASTAMLPAPLVTDLDPATVLHAPIPLSIQPTSLEDTAYQIVLQAKQDQGQIVCPATRPVSLVEVLLPTNARVVRTVLS